MFKRRTPRKWWQSLVGFFFPDGGWRRATSYVLHRLRRLPDTPERICIGIACGAFVSFLPLFTLHFVTAALLAWAFRGNILAAILGTFFGNPITFPIMAVSALELGNWLLGNPGSMSFGQVMGAIGRASSELMFNLSTLVSGETAHWGRLQVFWWRVFAPYTLGGIIIGAPISVALYYIMLPLTRAYQKRRMRKLQDRVNRARDLMRAREGDRK
jgi:uncharacterized protein (DUF2062 family)